MATGESEPLEELLRQEVKNLRHTWGTLGIDARGIAAILRRDLLVPPSKQLSGYVTAPGSRQRFDEAMQRLGEAGTLEALVLDDRFRSLFSERVRRHARLRLNRRPEPRPER